jgi:hypothetical protein
MMSKSVALKVGDKVRIVAEALSKKDNDLHGKIGEVVECRHVGDSRLKRVSVRFPNGRLLINKDAGGFERI